MNQTREFTGRKMLYIMLGFFGVIIAVNVTMAVIASQTWTGLIVKNSYVASQEFNGELEKAKAQEALGWKSGVSYEDGALRFRLVDAEGAPVVLDRIEVHAGRPAHETDDRTVALRPVDIGTYGADLALAPGDWALSVEGAAGEDAYRRDLRIRVDETGAGRMQ